MTDTVPSERHGAMLWPKWAELHADRQDSEAALSALGLTLPTPSWCRMSELVVIAEPVAGWGRA